MNFSFENLGTHTFLVYEVNGGDMIDSMSLGMITNNKIHGFAHTMFTQMNDAKYIKYDVSSKISAKQFFTGPVNKKRLLGVFNGIIDAIIAAEDYMIDINSIIYDLEYMFVDVSTCETVLICLPLTSFDSKKVDLGAFFKSIMFSTQFDQTEKCDHVAIIINYLNSAPVFSPEEFKKILISVTETGSFAAEPVQPPIAQKPQPQQPVKAKAASDKQPMTVKQPQPKPQQNAPRNIAKAPVQQPVNQGCVNVPSAVKQPVIQPSEPENKISLMKLLMHYSKENAELYKSQKAAKKGAQANKESVAPPKVNKRNMNFAIPGEDKPADAGFEIPGHQASIQPEVAPVQPIVTPNPINPPVQQQVNSYNVQAPAPVASVAPQMPESRSMNFGETTILGHINLGETTVLGVADMIQAKPTLIRMKNNEKINIDKPVFRIGKEKSYVDYFIADNSAISRSHANIITRDGEYFIVDTNSTNHTYVDGQMVQSNVEARITDGAKIRLANEDFEFHIN